MASRPCLRHRHAVASLEPEASVLTAIMDKEDTQFGLGLLLLAIAMALSSCSPSEPIKVTHCGLVDVQLLFENDGVKVYRFYDSGYTVYYADARGSVSWQQHVGKSTVPMSSSTADSR